MDNIHILQWSDFEKVEIRTGTIISAEPFPEAKKSAYKITVDFGTAGMKKTSAQITRLYRAEDLPGLQVLGVVNFPPRQIANFMSEFLLLGAIGEEGEVTLLTTERITKNGMRVG